MDCLKYHENAKTKHFYNNIFEKGAISIINCPNGISEHSASLIDNILTTDIFSNSLRKGIINRMFSIIFQYFSRYRVFNNRNIISFKEQLSLLHCRHIDSNGTVNEIYDTFLRIVTDIYDANCPIWSAYLKIKISNRFGSAKV